MKHKTNQHELWTHGIHQVEPTSKGPIARFFKSLIKSVGFLLTATIKLMVGVVKLWKTMPEPKKKEPSKNPGS